MQNLEKTLATVLAILVALTSLSLIAVYAEEIPAGLEYDISDGEAVIIGYTGTASEITIPKTINGNHVTSINAGAFEDCTNLISVVISDGINNIEENIFFGCTNLTSVYIPESVKV